MAHIIFTRFSQQVNIEFCEWKKISTNSFAPKSIGQNQLLYIKYKFAKKKESEQIIFLPRKPFIQKISKKKDLHPKIKKKREDIFSQPPAKYFTFMSPFLADTATVSVIIPESTTAAPTTTTDRHITFLEDSRNIAWLTVASIMLAGLLLFCAYLIVRFGSFPCKNGSFKPNAQYVFFLK